MMNVPNYPVQNTTQTQAQTYQQPVYTQQPAYYPQVNYQTVPTPAYPQQYVYPQTQQAAPVQQPQQAMQAPQIPQVDTSRIAVQLTSDLVAECAALVELNKLAVNVTKEIEQRLTQTTKILTIFLSAVASVSLVVGGIGIMNIMLVSVTERTKEIGTRLAIGALESDVLLQFLIESVVVSALGGIIGIVLAFFISWWASYQMNIPFIFDIWTALGAFAFSALVGVIFGYLPARRASRLDPIEALRYE